MSSIKSEILLAGFIENETIALKKADFSNRPRGNYHSNGGDSSPDRRILPELTASMAAFLQMSLTCNMISGVCRLTALN